MPLSDDSKAQAGTSNEYLLAVTVGERKPLNSTVYLAPYDHYWPKQFALQASRIRDALPEKVLLLEHVGSGIISETAHRHGPRSVRFRG